MNINGQNVIIDDLISQKYMHIYTKNNIYLSEYQISILNMFKIDYKSCSNIKELIYIINDVLDEEDDDELEEILKQICEFDYYHNTNK